MHYFSNDKEKYTINLCILFYLHHYLEIFIVLDFCRYLVVKCAFAIIHNYIYQLTNKYFDSYMLPLDRFKLKCTEILLL